MKFVLRLSELDAVYHIHEVCFEPIQIFMLWGAFSGFKFLFTVGVGVGIGIGSLISFIGVFP